MDLGKIIHEKALECGYDNCGVIPLEAFGEYKESLKERIAKFPEAAAVLETPLASLKLKENYPWAKSAIICTEYYGKYKFPASLQGMYAKSFLLSSDAPEYPNHKGKESFEKWMISKGIQYEGGETNMPGKIFPLRQAAVAAGLGIFRKNNFFYGPKGSWYGLEGYLIDKSCEYIQEISLKPCSETCNLCQKACPTHSLSEPFTMNPTLCLSFLATFGGRNIPDNLSAEQYGTWIMGCDACQDACPYNKRHSWNEGEDFPGLKEIEALLQPKNIISASDEELIQKVISRAGHHLTSVQTDVLRINATRVISSQKC